MNKMLATLIAFSMLFSMAFAAVDVTANVGNTAPDINLSSIELCDGSCALTKSVDPASQLTIKVQIVDPNGASDINLDTLSLTINGNGNTGGTAGWDKIALSPVSHGTRDGCTESGDIYCLQVDSGDWTTKFIAGLIDSLTIAVSDNAEEAATTSGSFAAELTVNAAVGHSEDATTGAYSGTPGNTDAILANGNAYITTTHNGNVNIDITVTATALSDSVHTDIAVGQQKWYLHDSVGDATPFTGAADTVKSTWGRGTDPTSATQDVYYWLDIPAGQPAGAYTGTLTYNSSASA